MNKPRKKLSYLINFLLIICSTCLVGVILKEYCNLFDISSLLAKKRFSSDPLFIIIFTPTIFWISSYICKHYSPNASGLGMDSVKQILLTNSKGEELNPKLSKLLNVKLAIVTIISSLLGSFGGGSLGKEGSALSISSSFFFTIKEKFRKFLPQTSDYGWVFAGSSLGLAVAFNAPLAGLCYAAEKILFSKYLNSFAIISSTLITLLTFVFILQNPAPLFQAHNFNFDISAQILAIIVSGLVCGIIATFFKKILAASHRKFNSITSSFWHIVPIFCGLLVALISIYSGIYSFGGGIETIKQSLLNPGLLSYKEVIGRIFNTLLTFTSGCAGGLIAPAVAIGNGLGSIFGSIFTDYNSTIFMLSAMSAFLAVTLGEPLTASLVIFEITGQPIYSLPFLASSAILAIIVNQMLKRCKIV